ncbi:hypothetical protein [Paenibacillus sp. FSL H8-0079]|uniref:hypothetical protein n=1 Tax=Paenibacillus sp. FSL H8-0079 TaxID=2921375 RepID=UPI0030EB787D
MFFINLSKVKLHMLWNDQQLPGLGDQRLLSMEDRLLQAKRSTQTWRILRENK